MSKMAVSQGHGTIKAAASFDPEADAAVFRKAMKGIGNYFYFLFLLIIGKIYMYVCVWFVFCRYG